MLRTKLLSKLLTEMACMVTTLNITLDDDVADRARRVKDEQGLTWPEYIEAAAEALDDDKELDDFI